MKLEYTTDWTTYYHGYWSKWLNHYKNQNNITALEIGVHEGRSSRWFCTNILTGSNCRLDCIDIWNSNIWPHKDAETRFDNNTKELQIRKFKGRSIKVLSELANTNNYSFIYVDGSHHPEDILADLVISWHILQNGGLLIADDYYLLSPHIHTPIKTIIDLWLSMTNNISRHEITSVGQGQIAVWKK